MNSRIVPLQKRLLCILVAVLGCHDLSAAQKRHTRPECPPVPQPPPPTSTYLGCGPAGNAKGPPEVDINPFKNRIDIPKRSDINRNITLAGILAPGRDSRRYSDRMAAEIVGYVVKVIPGGIETCNCKTRDVSRRDTHIEIVADAQYANQKLVSMVCQGKRIPKDTNEKYHMIVEVTPRFREKQRAKGIDWSTDGLQKLQNHWVRFAGWMFFDCIHSSESENTNPGNKCNWRTTAWEIHPVTKIEILNR